MWMLEKAVCLCVPHADRPAAFPYFGQTWSPIAAFRLTDLSLFATFALAYEGYAPRVKGAAAFLSTWLRAGPDRPFGKDSVFKHALSLMLAACSGASICHRYELYNKPFQYLDLFRVNHRQKV